MYFASMHAVQLTKAEQYVSIIRILCIQKETGKKGTVSHTREKKSSDIKLNLCMIQTENTRDETREQKQKSNKTSH